MSNEIQEKIGEALKEWAQGRVVNAVNLLAQQEVEKGSPLSQSIQTTELSTGELSVSIGFTANDYYIFLDEGVRGLKNKVKTSGMFSFKTRFPSRDMISNIRDYLPRYGMKYNKQGLPKLNKQTIDQASVAVAFAVKQKGVNQKPFWKPTFNEKAYNELARLIEEKLETQIELTLKIE
jgi:hypothetical protein